MIKKASFKLAIMSVSITVSCVDNELESSDSHSVSGAVTERHFYRDEEQVTLQIERHSSSLECNYAQRLAQKFIRCSAQTTVFHIRQFITKKLQLPPLYELEILFDGEILHNDQTLGSVWLSHWKKISPMPMFYKIKKNNQHN
jgi:polycomb group RING finger protein 3